MPKPAKPTVPPAPIRTKGQADFSSKFEASLLFQETLTDYNDAIADYVDGRAIVAAANAAAGNLSELDLGMLAGYLLGVSPEGEVTAVANRQKTILFDVSPATVMLANASDNCANDMRCGPFHQPFQAPRIFPGLLNFSTTVFDMLALSDFIPVQNGDEFGWDLDADESGGNIARCVVYIYDENMQPLTSEGGGGAYISLPATTLYTNDGRGYYASTTNVETGSINTLIGSVERPEVAYIQIGVISYAAGTWRRATGFIYGQPERWERQAGLTIGRHTPAMAGIPTQGYAPDGFQYFDTTISKIRYVSYAYETFANGVVPSDGTSLTVYDAASVANGDIVGVLLDNNATHWTTVSGLSSNTFTIGAVPTGRSIPDNARVVFNRWAI